MGTFHLKIIAYDKIFYDEEAASVVLPAIDGEVQILTNHEECVVALMRRRVLVGVPEPRVSGRTATAGMAARAGGSVSRKRRGQNLELGPLLDRRLVRGRPLPRRNAAHPDRRPRLCGASRLSEKRRAETRQIAASPHLGLLFQSASFGFGTDDRGSRHGPFRTPLFGAHHARKGPMTGRSGDS